LVNFVPDAVLYLIKGEKTCDLCDDPGADVNKLQKVEQEEYDSSHEADGASASDVIEKLNSSI
jgi:hypothetical protein